MPTSIKFKCIACEFLVFKPLYDLFSVGTLTRLSLSFSFKQAMDKSAMVVEHATHQAAGEGVMFERKGKGVPSESPLKRSAAALPEGFIASVFESHTGKQHVDYLPTTANLNVAKEVGVVKPRNIAEDWEAAGFDPWSSGKDPFSTCFVPTLNFEQEDVADVPDGEFVDQAGLTQAQLRQKQANKEAADLEFLISCCRHGKYSDIEQAINSPDWSLPIDAKDAAGNTLLLVAAQNGNKRIAKLALRRGASINEQNLNGQSVLHYCFSYGFEDLAEYFMDKGADDALLNADGLTCYEGLNADAVDNI